MSNEVGELKQYIIDKNAVIFIGPEISRFVTAQIDVDCDLKILLREGIQQCCAGGNIDRHEAEEIIRKFDTNTENMEDYYFAADKIKHFMCDDEYGNNRQRFSTWLTQWFTNMYPRQPILIDSIARLECPILTTNYDTLLSDVLQRRPTTFNRSLKHGIVMSSKTLDSEILHIYGNYRDTKNMIFTRDDYNTFLNDESAQSKLEVMIESKAIILIGYDDTAPNPILFNLLKWISTVRDHSSTPVFMLTPSDRNKKHRQLINASFLADIRIVEYGFHMGELMLFINNLLSYKNLIRENSPMLSMRDHVKQKYLHALIKEYGHVSIMGNTGSNINLPLQSVYVELKFDPTHPSIKAMKAIEIDEEFRRKLVHPGFFTNEELAKLRMAFIANDSKNPINTTYGYMFDQCLNIMLNDRKAFSEAESDAIQQKVSRLKQSIMKQSNLKESQQYRIQQAFNEFKHMIVLGHPGSGKTTLSKWLAMNMAKKCLMEQNMLYDGTCNQREKLPILIPIWKYFHLQRASENNQRISLLEFICEKPLDNMDEFTLEERSCLHRLIMEILLRGHALVIFEGLDEVPAQTDRSDLMREVNNLLERGIEFDFSSKKLVYSIHECKEINNTKNPDIGNRFIVTSRIEGNYFDELNFYVPRLTIENMSNDALKLFCDAYMKCINDVTHLNQSSGNSSGNEQLFNEIIDNKDILQLAINPQLASVIAAVYNQYNRRLPKTRIELYEKAIDTMVERLVSNQDYFLFDKQGEKYHIDSVLIWSVLENIAFFLHSQVEGLTELSLKNIIEKCLEIHEDKNVEQSQSNIDRKIMKLVDLFKYQAGVLNEFGYDSYRFIHRTFQEYLSAKCILYSNGKERKEEEILKTIINKITIPNWRVPLSMTFGILSESFENDKIFDIIILKLLETKNSIENSDNTTSLIPFVIIDSINDISFKTSQREYDLIRKLADLLLIDYKNRSGFSRLIEHQELIHSYFVKLKTKQTNILSQWFIGKIFNETNVTLCANIIYHLKWYDPIFHQQFLNSLQYDNHLWKYPIDSLLRFYSIESQNNSNSSLLKFKVFLEKNTNIIERIQNDPILLPLITILYGGYKNYDVAKTIPEYNQIAAFLSLSDTQRAPFIFYYQEVWDKTDTAYSMAVYLDTSKSPSQWIEKPKFDVQEIYQESYLTAILSKLLAENQPTTLIIELIKDSMKSSNLSQNQKLDISLSLIATHQYDLLDNFLKTMDKNMINRLKNRLDQSIYTLKDSIARYSSHLQNYWISLKMDMMQNPLNYKISFKNYLKIYLSLIAKSGGLPISTKELALNTQDDDEKCTFYVEYIVYKLTGSAKDNDIRHSAAKALDDIIGTTGVSNIVQSFMKMGDAIQKYRPNRTYPWEMDTFIFHSNVETDIPIAFINCLENAHPEIGFIVDALTDVFLHQGYFNRNSDLIPIVILLNFGILSKDINMSKVCNNLLPESNQNKDIKSLLLGYVDFMIDPYYRSRVFYQLAEFYDSKSHELLIESFNCVKNVENPVLKFQVLEKIHNVACYKQSEDEHFIENTIDELRATVENISDPYNLIIACTRLSFYKSGDFRKLYLTIAVETLMKMNESEDKIELMIKLRPILDIYTDLRQRLTDIMKNLGNIINLDLFNGCLGRILINSNEKKTDQGVERFAGQSETVKSEYYQIESIFQLFADLNDVRLKIDNESNKDQLWINLLVDENKSSTLEKILHLAVQDEIFLTPQRAMIIDTLIEQGKEDEIALLFPYVIRPSNEVLPIVQRWFRRNNNEYIKKLAALLLAEGRRIFEAAVDPIVDLLGNDNDQIRYRAQRIFQHPDRDVSEPSKRISLIGERTLMKIFSQLREMHLPRVYSHLSATFFDLLWDDPIVLRNFHQLATDREAQNLMPARPLKFYNRIYFTNVDTWNVLMEIIPSLSSQQVEQVLHSVMHMTNRDQISGQNWIDFARILSTIDMTQFSQQMYFTQTDTEIVGVMLENLYLLGPVQDQAVFEMLETKVLYTVTTPLENLPMMNYQQIKQVGRCNFNVHTNFNENTMNIINDFTINTVLIENLVNWSMQKMSTYAGVNDSWCSLMILECILCLLATFILKDSYAYRKITSSASFDRARFIELVEFILNRHWFFSARGNAFILLAALNHDDHMVIVNSFNTLLDENVVKEYTIKAIPLISLSSHEFLDDLIGSLNNESAIRTYEILKVFTQFVLNEKLDENDKSKIIHYLSKEVALLKSKKPVNYFYTDMKIPFTTTLELELYKSWVKIQGLSGKAQYVAKPPETIEFD